MPFTLAHPAAALLLRRTPLPVAAMVAGAMSPDVPVFLDAYGRPYHFTHSALGIVTVDLAVGLLGVAFWFSVLRDPIVDVAPAAVRERLAPRARYDRTQWRLAVLAVVAGSVTHVVWDLFTHHDRWGVRHISWLGQRHGQMVGYHWTQYGSSVVGLTICAIWATYAVRSRPRQPRPARVPQLGVRAFVAVLVVTVGSGLVAGVNAPDPGPRMFVSQTAVVATMIGSFLLLVVAIAWNVLTTATRRA
ncbi:MAG: DUF4184 family protein [Marmoricola sp.]